VLRIKERIEQLLHERFNFCLLNWYRNGDECVGEHSDDESDLVPGAVIACVSLGATRTFVLRHKTRAGLVRRMVLENGSLLVMRGATQRFWKHGVPRDRRVLNGRVSLTFRVLRNNLAG
jgi:alkylated DNA repair dioxygenase AlkB